MYDAMLVTHTRARVRDDRTSAVRQNGAQRGLVRFLEILAKLVAAQRVREGITGKRNRSS